MYGESATMRKRADQLRDQATDIRSMADRLVGQIEAINWEGRAAADMRARIHDRAAHLRDCADLHETASDSLTRHVAEVERPKDSIEAVQRRAPSLFHDPHPRLARLPPQAPPPPEQPP